MSGARRRNGQNAACEPCRKSKIRCDHGSPVCGRCRRRSLHAQCYYHPAPMSKAGEDRFGHTETDTDASSISTPAHAAHSQVEPSPLASSTPSVPFRGNIGSNVVGAFDTPSLPSIVRNDSPTHIIAGILDALEYFDLIQEAVNLEFKSAKASCIPTPLVLPVVDSLQNLTGHDHLFDEHLSNKNDIAVLAHGIWKSTAAPILITRDMTPATFVSMYSGPNLRLEYLGLVCSLAARQYFLWPTTDGNKRKDFTQSMFHCSTACLALARRLSPITLPMVWLSFDHMLLCGNVHGENSEVVWHRLGDVSNDVLALGLHKEAYNTENMPVWLAECRRKMFMKSYTTDMALSELLNRPPRLSRRYSDCLMPLDLSDEELLAEPEEFERAKSRLSPEGWNLRGELFTTTNNRIRCILMELREEVLGLQFRRTARHPQPDFNALLARNRQSWESLPPYLRYTFDTSASAPPSSMRTMISLMYLAVLETELQILRMQGQESTHAATCAIKTSSETLAVVVELAAFPRHLVSTCNYNRIMFKYGLPAAFSLTSTLSTSIGQGTQVPILPNEVTVSSLIRNLSVFASQLKNAALPSEANYAACQQASEAISRTLDQILDGSLGSSTRSATAAVAGVGQEMTGFGLPRPNASMDMGFTNLDLWSDLDVESWMNNIAISAPGDDWIAF